MSIEILPDGDALALRAADLFALAAQEAAAARGRFAVALSGGETPRALYRLLARQQFSQKVPWRRVQLYWGDERCVPPDDAQSNYGMARDAFIKHVPIAAENVHRMRGEDLPEEAAQAYDAELRGLAAQSRPQRRGARLRPRAARPRAGRPHGLALPAQRRARRGGPLLGGDHGARRVAQAHRDGARDQRRAPGLVPGQRRREGRHGRRGARGAARAEGRTGAGRRPVHGALTWFLDEAAAAELSPEARA